MSSSRGVDETKGRVKKGGVTRGYCQRPHLVIGDGAISGELFGFSIHDASDNLEAGRVFGLDFFVSEMLGHGDSIRLILAVQIGLMIRLIWMKRGELIHSYASYATAEMGHGRRCRVIVAPAAATPTATSATVFFGIIGLETLFFIIV